MQAELASVRGATIDLTHVGARNGSARAAFLQAMSFTQLSTPLPVSIEDKGKGLAFAVVDYGPEHDLIWVTALDESGEIWCAPNPKVRMRANWTMGRSQPATME